MSPDGLAFEKLDWLPTSSKPPRYCIEFFPFLIDQAFNTLTLKPDNLCQSKLMKVKSKLDPDLVAGIVAGLSAFCLLLVFTIPILSQAYSTGAVLRDLQISDRSIVPNLVPFFLVFLVPGGSLSIILSSIFLAWSLKKFGRNLKTAVIAILPSLSVVIVCVGVVFYYRYFVIAMADYVAAQKGVGPLPLNEIELQLRSLQFNCFLLAMAAPMLTVIAVGGLCSLVLSSLFSITSAAE